VDEPERLRAGALGLGARLRLLAGARRRFLRARPWNPLRAFGPRLQPVVHVADEEARATAQAIVESLLPLDRKGRPRAARRFEDRARATARTLGGVYHAERFWLFLPSGDGLPEAQHPSELAEL
jgi:hypothetical protein